MENSIKGLSKQDNLLDKLIIFPSLQSKLNDYKAIAGDYCVGVIPDPIPNSEVKPSCADGTLS